MLAEDTHVLGKHKINRESLIHQSMIYIIRGAYWVISRNMFILKLPNPAKVRIAD